MKNISWYFFVITILLFSVNSFAQDENHDAMMKAWQESMTPGPQHKLLAEMVGEWDGEITMWMDPETPPQTYQGTTKYESIFDGRYIVGHYSGIMMGMPFSGMDITGYDNIKKVFFTSWIDNMGTGVLYVEGNYDEKTKTYTYSGETVDLFGNKMTVKNVITIQDKDHNTFEMFMNTGKGEMKTMEIKYTRKS